MSLIEQALLKMRAGGSAVRDRVGPARAPRAATPDGAGGLRVAGEKITVDSAKLLQLGILPQPADERRHAAQYRHIKRPLLAAIENEARDAKPTSRVIMVTSALAGEGKTFTAINLALSFALERDYAVLLIDADAQKPRLSGILGTKGRPGLTDAAEDDARPVEEFIFATNVPGLELLPYGNAVAHSTEYWSSLRMQAVIAQLSTERNRIVVLDGPPMLLTTEAPAIAAHAGQIALVVRADATPQEDVKAAIGLLGDRGGVGLILNGASTYTRYYGYESDSD